MLMNYYQTYLSKSAYNDLISINIYFTRYFKEINITKKTFRDSVLKSPDYPWWFSTK